MGLVTHFPLPVAHSTSLVNDGNITFDKSIDDKNEAAENCELATVERIAAGNILYTEMARFCSIGKSLYEDTDEAKYNHYIINERATQKAKAAA